MNQTNVLHRYSNRDVTLNELNLYKFCAFHWNSKPDAIIPHFFGFRDVGTWPLKEEYSKFMLVIFKPWRTTCETLKHEDGTYSSALIDFMYNPLFPTRKHAEILRSEQRFKGIDNNEGQYLHDDNLADTHGNNHAQDIFYDALNNAMPQALSLNSNENVGLSLAYFKAVPSREPKNYNW